MEVVDEQVRKDVKTVLDAFAAGLFVRTTAGDGDPGWAIKFALPLAAIARLKVWVDGDA